MPSVILITGAGTGIGNLAARALAADGHTVYASMRDLEGHNADNARELLDIASRDAVDLRVVELDVQSQQSCNKAVEAIVNETGQLDVAINNAGHLYVGYTEAYTDDDVTQLFDINAVGPHRVNRAVLPHMRSRRSGTLLYVGSTIPITTPPFLGPYVASKAAMDALAIVTMYEVSQFGIETIIVMPGAFTEGTNHFPNAGNASDAAVASAYSELDPLVARNEEATESLFRPDSKPDPAAVGEEIVRILALPFGTRPLRSVVDFTDSGDNAVERVNEVAQTAREEFVTRMGFGNLLRIKEQPIKA
jgi:NAD(P)-dependent dehydrogenase (short-subunit alcohol dehydrogenase family)